MKNEENVKRVDSIVGIRGIACLFVDDQGMYYDAIPWMFKSKYFFEYSKNAVEMFFMLAGFLIAWNYRKVIQDTPFGVYFKKRYGKLIGASLAVNLWALINAFVRIRTGLTGGLTAPTPLRFLLSVLMINTGWFTSYSQTQLPVNSTMWFIDVLLLCYLIYYVIGRIGKNDMVYTALCILMVGIGWICLEYSPKLPFLWGINGRGYAPFFLGALLAEFQIRADRKLRVRFSAVLGAFVMAFFIYHMFVGFENVFGEFGTRTYVRYFEFAAAPGLLLTALNLTPVARVLSWKPLMGLSALSTAIYYVHNCLMEDCMIVNHLAGNPVDLCSWPAFLIILVGIIPAAMVFRKITSSISYFRGRRIG